MHALRKWLGLMAILLTVVLIAAGCGDGGEEEVSVSEDAGGWSLIPLEITESSAGSGQTLVRVEFAARNDSGDWSAMRPADADEESISLVTGGRGEPYV